MLGFSPTEEQTDGSKKQRGYETPVLNARRKQKGNASAETGGRFSLVGASIEPANAYVICILHMSKIQIANYYSSSVS